MEHRCVIVGVVNLSSKSSSKPKASLKSSNRLGSKFHVLSSKERLSSFGGSVCGDNVLVYFGYSSRLKEVISIELMCNVFYGKFGSAETIKVTGTCSVDYLHKHQDPWHSLYVIAINENMVR